MDPGDSTTSMQDTAQKALVNVTRVVGQIAAEDLDFYRASNPKGGKKLDKQNQKLLKLASRLLKSAADGSDVSAPLLPDVEAVDENWRGIVEVVDNLLEKADTALDEYTGVIKKVTATEEEQAPQPKVERGYSGKRVHFGPKPQLQFKSPPSNNETTAFKPLLRSKPHAVVSLEKSLEVPSSEDAIIEYEARIPSLILEKPAITKICINNYIRYPHPYGTEIQQYRYPKRVYKKSEPIPYKPLEEAQATLIDTIEGVQQMLEELKQAKEIAVDLEHHDKHSYIGIVSLMQISTRDKDWIVDTLKPWREELQMLNEVFADPSIVKVLHGAFMDIVWLQRDLGLYVVGLFDTYHASHALGYPKHSLAWLLAKFANFEAQKAYQMADWRIRPLPQEFIDYARADTHFLLYVYDMMRNELVNQSLSYQPDGDLVTRVLELSKEESLRRFERPIYDMEQGTGPNGWYNLLIKTPALFKSQQFAVFKAVHQWRDRVARQQDESLFSIMQNNVLFSISRHMPLNVSALLGCSSPISNVLRARATEVVGVVKQAQLTGENGPDMNEVLRTHPLTIESEKKKKAYQAQFKQASGPSVAEVLRREKGLIQKNLQLDAIVSPASQFWGPTVKSNKKRRLDRSGSSARFELQLHVPLPPLTAEVYSNTDSGAVAPAQPAQLPEHEFKKSKRKSEDEVLVLRELGKKQKRKAATQEEEDVVPEQNGEQSVVEAPDVPEPEVSESKAERKARKRAEKQRKREEKEKLKEASKAERPVDYTKEPSMLNPKPDKKEKKDKKDKTKAPFNPYAKSMDAPKGMRKAKKEIQGKSHTFKG